MSRGQLESKVAEAGGWVFVGFKDPEAQAGVDDHGRVLAKRASVEAGRAALKSLGIVIDFQSTDLPMVVAHVPAGRLAAILDDPRVEYVEPIFPGRRASQTTPWNVTRVDAPSAWSSATGNGRTVWIIDSGIDGSLTDQHAATGIGTCMPSPDNGYDTDGHGTMVAGIISTLNNSSYAVGVAPDVRLFSIKDGDGTPWPPYTACGVESARIHGATTINISTTFDDEYTALTDQINAAWYTYGILVVGAAGNDNGGPVGYPASLDAVMAVSGTDYSDNWYSTSSSGSKVEISAPGSGIQTLCLGATLCYNSGTSFSAPHVAAAAALLKSYNPYWSAVEIRRRLNAGAIDLGSTGRDPYFGWGRLSVTAAIATAPLTLQVTIGGPSSHPSNYTAQFTAYPIDGLPPFVQYTWRVNGTIQQQSSSPSFNWSSSSDYTISVTVLDSANATASNSLDVTVCPGQFQC